MAQDVVASFAPICAGLQGLTEFPSSLNKICICPSQKSDHSSILRWALIHRKSSKEYLGGVVCLGNRTVALFAPPMPGVMSGFHNLRFGACRVP